MSRALATIPFLVAGCQPLPHPFEDAHAEADAPILQVADSAGVVVAPVEGVPEPAGKGLAEAMAAALRDREIPAATVGGNKRSYRLTGTVETAPSGADATLRLRWSLKSYDGKLIGSDDQNASLPNDQWVAGGGPAFAELAKAEAPKLGTLIEDPAPVEHEPTRLVYVRPVEGAPGDGDQALPSALLYLFKQRGVTVTSDPKGKDAVTVAGNVAVSPVQPNQERVQITWHVLKADGKDFGQVAQENTVPRGTLDGKWGEIAMAVAMAGVDDIMRVVSAAAAPNSAG